MYNSIMRHSDCAFYNILFSITICTTGLSSDRNYIVTLIGGHQCSMDHHVLEAAGELHTNFAEVNGFVT
jgi:hypothetical protein